MVEMQAMVLIATGVFVLTGLAATWVVLQGLALLLRKRGWNFWSFERRGRESISPRSFRTGGSLRGRWAEIA